MSAPRESRVALRWYRIKGGWRCKIGVHRLRGHIDCGDGIHVAPYDPYVTRPARGAWRVCDWCGARWEAAYDPAYGRPFWQRRYRGGRQMVALSRQPASEAANRPVRKTGRKEPA